MHTPTPPGVAMLAYCLCYWHAQPQCSVSVAYPYLYCAACHVVAHIDLVGYHIELKGSEGGH